ncbi:MAG: high frequency lysogenization protein HflD [Gammaproteobacteria bacterium]|jgi:high frequency lysogenization protein|nr:high frequency lysogenization protein HflD [Gammaproteobacteria bacterium]
MTEYSVTDRVTALGGIFQAARLARDIARTGVCDAGAFEASRESLFEFEPDSVAAVFGGRQGVRYGLRTLYTQLEKPQQRDLEIARYVISLLNLADRLRAGSDSMRNLYNELSALGRRREQFELGDSTQHEQLAKIYQDVISVLGPKIMIRGEPLHLQNPDNATRIRVALLAGIRAAVLWRQAGGKKWQLLLRRRAIAASARDLVDSFDS